MRQALALLAATVLAGPAAAACAPGQEAFLSCTVSGGRKALDVCFDPQTVTYTFGPTGGAPELSLATPVAAIEYEPWPGIGRTIWEAVTFQNEGVAYVVHGAIERDYPEVEDGEVVVTVTGGVRVMQGETEIASLACDPGSSNFLWGEGLYNAKTAAGYCLDDATRVWHRCN